MRQASILARLGALKTKFDEDGPVKQLVLEHATLTAEDQAALESMSREDVRVFIVPFQLSINDVELLIDTMQKDLDRRRQGQWQAQEAVDDARAKSDGVKQLDMSDIPSAPDAPQEPAEADAAPSQADAGGHWFCPECECEVPPEEVTLEETHQPLDGECGAAVEWIAEDAVDRYYCLECKRRVPAGEVYPHPSTGGLIHKPEDRQCNGEVYAAGPGDEAPDGVTEGEGGDAGTDEGPDGEEEHEAINDQQGSEAVV